MTKDPSEQLQALYVAGFDLETFERYPKAIGVVRGECIVLLVPGATNGGLQMLGTPGWKLGGEMGVLTSINGCPVFQNKSQVLEATAERREALQRFRDEVSAVLKS